MRLGAEVAGPLLEGGDFLVHPGLVGGVGGLGPGQGGPELVTALHQLEFPGLEAVHLVRVAGHFVAQGLVLLVFAGLELLVFEAGDGLLAGGHVQFEILDGDFVLIDRGLGLLHRLLVLGQPTERQLPLLRDAFEFLAKLLEPQIALLQLQEGVNVGLHRPFLPIGMAGSRAGEEAGPGAARRAGCAPSGR